ncbi:MAG: type II toxin-antitoxin system RelB/DinJ family antitoxin [Kiritimatiellia bacterium]
MKKSAMVRARLEPDLKTKAEHVFHRLGLNATQAITMFYKQVELRGGLPLFEDFDHNRQYAVPGFLFKEQ